MHKFPIFKSRNPGKRTLTGADINDMESDEDRRRNGLSETDAYLAAFATSGGYGLLTFDREFARFKGIVLAKL